MKCKKLALTSLALALSSTTFAYCPEAKDIQYNAHHGIWYVNAQIHDRRPSWESKSTKYISPNTPKVEFLQAQIMTNNGEKNPFTTSAHVMCLYKVNNSEGLIVLEPYQRVANAKILNASDAWQFYSQSRTGDGATNFGSWICSWSEGKCAFELS